MGTGTALADNPRLTARTGTDARQPLRVVMGFRKPADDAAIRGPGFLHLRTRDVHGALSQLTHHGVRHLMVEGGPTVAGAFLRAGVVDEVFTYVAPILLGDGTPMLPSLGIPTLAEASRWQLDPAGGVGLTQLGADIRLHLRPEEIAGRSELFPTSPDTPLHDSPARAASHDQEPPCSQE